MKKIIILFCACVSLLFSGCHGVDDVIQVNQESVRKLQQNRQKTIEYNKANYPLTIENLNSHGEKELFTFKKPPQRVVAVWQNSIETLIALGLEDRIIAGMGIPSDKCLKPEHREAYNKIPYHGLELMDMENLIMNEPDMILGWYSTFSEKVMRGTDFWQGRGVNTYIAKTSYYRSGKKFVLQDEYDYILDLGKIFDRQEKAQAIVKKMQDEIAYVKTHTVASKNKPRAMIIEFMGKNIRGYTDRSLAGDILNNLQAIHVEPKATTLSQEQLVEANPDAIFIVVIERNYGKEQMYIDMFLDNPALRELSCVKAKRLYTIPLLAVYAPGVRVQDGIEIMARGLYPELYKEKKEGNSK
ncbi:MAG: ABC transporter substrate-binding protein [Phascolarctobacterium sp.]|nr:ABC transporter substrate-binding protein [Phascolarctobacterium sp.]